MTGVYTNSFDIYGVEFYISASILPNMIKVVQKLTPKACDNKTSSLAASFTLIIMTNIIQYHYLSTAVSKYKRRYVS